MFGEDFSDPVTLSSLFSVCLLRCRGRWSQEDLEEIKRAQGGPGKIWCESFTRKGVFIGAALFVAAPSVIGHLLSFLEGGGGPIFF